MVRAVTTKQSGRPEPYRKSNPDGSGAWRHDLHDAVKQSLASRISGGARPATGRSQSSGSGGSSLASRLSAGPSAKGRELIPSGSSSSSKAPAPKLHGFDAPVPVNTNANLNAGVELLPARAKRTGGSVLDSRVVASGMSAAGLGQQRVQRQQHRTVPLQVHSSYVEPSTQTSPVSIFGAAKMSIVVRVENLAPGTTPDDVMSAFSSAPILSATEAQSQNKLVAVDLEFGSRGPADELIAQYNGVVADGNTLRLGIVRASLSERMGRQAQPSHPTLDERRTQSSSVERRTQSSGAGARKELVAAPGSGKMYSDTILASDPTSAVITVATDSGPAANRSRADAWARNAPAPRSNAAGGLAGRIGGSRGRGQAGGSRSAGMIVD